MGGIAHWTRNTHWIDEYSLDEGSGRRARREGPARAGMRGQEVETGNRDSLGEALSVDGL